MNPECAACWNRSILAAVAALGTFCIIANVGGAVQSLWATSSTIQAKPIAVYPALVASTQASSLRTHVVAAQSESSQYIPHAEAVKLQTSPLEHVRTGLMMVLAFCAGAWASSRLARTFDAAGSMDVEQPLTMVAAAAESEVEYHFLVANAKFMLFDEEQAMELLREKRRFLKEKSLPQDFWIVPNPEFLDNMPDIDKRVLKPCAALVSTDGVWIRFMKLRYDLVLMGSFKGPADIKKALATKGGDPLAVIPKWEVPADWSKNVPYPKYSQDWYLPFLVGAPES